MCRITGSHHIFRKQGCAIPVSVHGGKIKPIIAKQIIKQCQWWENSMRHLSSTVTRRRISTGDVEVHTEVIANRTHAKDTNMFSHQLHRMQRRDLAELKLNQQKEAEQHLFKAIKAEQLKSKQQLQTYAEQQLILAQNMVTIGSHADALFALEEVLSSPKAGRKDKGKGIGMGDLLFSLQPRCRSRHHKGKKSFSKASGLTPDIARDFMFIRAVALTEMALQKRSNVKVKFGSEIHHQLISLALSTTRELVESFVDGRDEAMTLSQGFASQLVQSYLVNLDQFATKFFDEQDKLSDVAIVTCALQAVFITKHVDRCVVEITQRVSYSTEQK